MCSFGIINHNIAYVYGSEKKPTVSDDSSNKVPVFKSGMGDTLQQSASDLLAHPSPVRASAPYNLEGEERSSSPSPSDWDFDDNVSQNEDEPTLEAPRNADGTIPYLFAPPSGWNSSDHMGESTSDQTIAVG